MLRYIKADMNRIMRRTTRWVFFGILVLAAFLIMWPDGTSTGVAIEDLFEKVLQYLPSIMAVIELGFVFGDDFKAKASQIAIGVGVSRRQVVIAKWFNMLICYLMDLAAFCVVTLVLTQTSATPIPSELFGALTIEIIMSVVKYMAFTAIILPILFATQGVNTAMLSYLLLAFGVVKNLLGLLEGADWFPIKNLTDFTLTNCINTAKSQLNIGVISWGCFIGILVYISAGIIGAVAIYRKRELEF